MNYTVSEDFTRITEFKYLTGQKENPETTIMREYPMPYEAKDGQIPYYAINNKENDALYEEYQKIYDETVSRSVEKDKGQEKMWNRGRGR